MNEREEYEILKEIVDDFMVDYLGEKLMNRYIELYRKLANLSSTGFSVGQVTLSNGTGGTGGIFSTGFV